VTSPRWLPAWGSRLLGARRRNRGMYDADTAELLRRAVDARPTPKNQLAYLRFRRDLGQLPELEEAARLLAALPRLRGPALRQACNLLCECGRVDDVLSALPRSALRTMAASSPPMAAALRDEIAGGPARRLAELHGSQEAWRRALADTVRQHQGSICVVGNAGSLVGARMGDAIDRHALVSRFNHYRSASTDDRDIGCRVDVWVRAPDLRGFATAKPPPWVVLSGADPRFQLGSWSPILTLLDAGVRVVTVPLSTWTPLVARLAAPPSAGLLYLAWLVEVLGDPATITAAGFQLGEPGAGAAYHQALPKHRGSERHRWPAERAILREWREQGLRFLDGPGTAATTS
jgi:hypothetical protein